MRADEPVFFHIRGGEKSSAERETAPDSPDSASFLRVNALLYVYSTRSQRCRAHFDNHGCRVARDSTDGLEELTTVTTGPRKKIRVNLSSDGICFANHSLPFWRLRLRLLSKAPSVKNSCGAN